MFAAPGKCRRGAFRPCAFSTSMATRLTGLCEGLAKRYDSWTCFHTTMFALELDGMVCGLIASTIGAPYAVLIAEQLHAAGARLIMGLTSAGRVSPELPLPCLLVATAAIRDEGTSYHYLPPSREVRCPTAIVPMLMEHLRATGWEIQNRVRCGPRTLPTGRLNRNCTTRPAKEFSQSKCRLLRSLHLGRRQARPLPR